MNAAEAITFNENVVEQSAATVVIGAGPVGAHVVRKLATGGTGSRIVLYGAEARPPYNRVSLESYLAGDINASAILDDTADLSDAGVETY
ncbi:MAG: NAD(P)H-nitrite reductase large subunit [Gammaproteobacteria bacterium]|jgi:NAD(P)H-nitrite reductase large subunit